MKKNQLAKGLAIAALGIALAGCDQYKDRPYVMTCYGETVADAPRDADFRGYTEQFPFHAGGIPLPSPEEMERRVGHERYSLSRGYFGLWTLTEEEGRLPPGNTTLTPITRERGHLYGWGDTGNIYVERYPPGTSMRVESGVITPMGSVEIEHYYLDGEGELHPINFQLTALYQARTAIPETKQGRRGAQLSAFIPADAKYAVYKATWDFSGTEGYENAEMFTGWWAEGFRDKHRFKPIDHDFAQRDSKALSEYALRVSNGPGYRWSRPGFATRSAPPDERSGYTGMNCYAMSGTPVRFTDFLNLDMETYRNDHHPAVIIGRPPNNETSRRMMFVGQDREDLENLPSNPKDWNGQDNYLWQEGRSRLIFPL